jgi:hypothetical protein
LFTDLGGIIAITNHKSNAKLVVYMIYKTIGSIIYKQRGVGEIKVAYMEIKT